MSDDTCHTDAVNAARGDQNHTTYVLWFIIVLAALLRLHGIADESVWWDEFTSVMHLTPVAEWEASPHYARWNQSVIRETAPGLLAFWKQNRTLDPATMPLYYTLEYFWHKHVGRSIPSLRLLSIIIGMLIVPAVYVLARDLYGKTAGLIAAFCVAVSPIHGQFAQEIRMYGMMTLLAVLSVYTFMHLVRDGKRHWWLLHALVSLPLFWTHPLAALVPLVEGAFWLLFRRRDLRRLVLWAGLTVLLMVPSVIYMSTIRFWSLDSTGTWMRLPKRHELVGDLLADDCIGLTYQLDATTDTWERFVSPEHAEVIIATRWLVGRWMVVMFLVYAGWLCGVNVWRAVRARRAGTDPPAWQWSFFLLMWWLAPPLVLYVISFVFRPCIMPRYTVHCSIALYVMLGGAVVSAGPKALKALAASVLVLFYGYQQMLVIDGTLHPDWRSAAAEIRAKAKPDDLILVHNWLWKRVFAYNLGPMPNVMCYSKTFDVLAEECAFFLGLNRQSRFVPEGPCEIWVVIRKDYFKSGPCDPFEKELAARGLTFSMKEFGGIQHVLLYHVTRDRRTPVRIADRRAGLPEHAPIEFGDLSLEFWRAEDYDGAIAAAKKAFAIDPGYSRAYSYLGMAYKEQGNAEAAVDAFREAVAIDPYNYPWAHVNMGMLLSDSEQYDEALAAFEQALQLIPDDAWTYTCMGKAYLGKGDVDAAVAAFEKAVQLAPDDLRGHQALQDALARKGGAAPDAVE